MSNQNLELYYLESCPYCHKVFDFMEKHDIELKMIDISDNPEATRRLKKEGGKKQVPCLFIDGQPLYESDDIIQWFKDNYIK